MTGSSIKRGILCISIILFSSATVFSQDYQAPDYRKLSLSIAGGASLGDGNRNFHFMSSNFTGDIENTPTLGLGLQYALTPAWSLEAGYRRTTIRGVTEQFETDMNLVTLKNIFNLNQILFINHISTRINPFLSAGIGYDFFSYSGPDEKFNSHNTSYNAGAGIVYKLSNTMDLFGHYEYHMGSNKIDNATDGWGVDLINSVTAGVRINFGKKNAIHPSWRTVPISLERSKYDVFLTQADRISELQRQIDQMNLREKDQEKQYLARIDSLQAHIDQLDQLKADPEWGFADLQCVEVREEPEFTESLASGHYVQVFATRHPIVANYIRGHAVRSLKKAFAESNHEVMIFHRKEFFEVIVGRFETVTQAREIQNIMTYVHKDAFVITFPRPVEMADDYPEIVAESN